MTCGKPSHIRKWFGPCVLSYGHGGSCEHPPLEALHESDGRCSKCGNDREAWDRAVAEIARLTAELAAARAVPADVEAAIGALLHGEGYSTDDTEIVALRTAIARAISDATAARETVGGLLATAPVYSIVEYMDADGDVWHQVEFNATMTAHRSRRVGDGAWGPWRQRDMPQRELRLPARIVPLGEMQRDPSQRGPLPKGG